MLITFFTVFYFYLRKINNPDVFIPSNDWMPLIFFAVMEIVLEIVGYPGLRVFPDRFKNYPKNLKKP